MNNPAAQLGGYTIFYFKTNVDGTRKIHSQIIPRHWKSEYTKVFKDVTPEAEQFEPWVNFMKNKYK